LQHTVRKQHTRVYIFITIFILLILYYQADLARSRPDNK